MKKLDKTPSDYSNTQIEFIFIESILSNVLRKRIYCLFNWKLKGMYKVGLERSISKKGLCAPDNSACEGLFGLIKNEIFYGRDWRLTSIRQFIEIPNELSDIVQYQENQKIIRIYKHKRIQTKTCISYLYSPRFCPHPPICGKYMFNYTKRQPCGNGAKISGQGCKAPHDANDLDRES